MKAINTFNVDKNIKLATYASRCIENEILMQLRRNTKMKNEVSIDEPLNKDGNGNELLLSDVLGTENDITSKYKEAKLDALYVKEEYRRLGSADKLIIEFKKWLSTNNVNTIEVNVCINNVKAKNLYIKHNFIPYKECLKCEMQ